MAIAILVGRDDKNHHQLEWFIDEWRNALLALEPELDIRVWPEVGNLDEIDIALVWSHPVGVLNTLPNLKAIISLAAGVDHIFADTHLPKNIPILRVKDPYMANDIVQYVVVCVLNYVKRIAAWATYQKTATWMRKPPFNYSDKTIGVMGLGFLGEKAAEALSHIGLKVIGWRHSAKPSAVKSFVGKAQFDAFLSHADILVCMLPLTSDTQNIMNKDTFAKLPRGAYIINLGRGEQLVEDDLLQALDSGHLSGACLDVFRREPLSSDHPFWLHPKIIVTPHIASVTNAATAAPQVLDNCHRVMAGEELLNRVDLSKGY